ncbi:hypothetical protein GCM10010471_07100 [Leucobacter komagatae]
MHLFEGLPGNLKFNGLNKSNGGAKHAISLATPGTQLVAGATGSLARLCLSHENLETTTKKPPA